MEKTYIDHSKVTGGLVIKTLEGEHIASVGDYIIKGVNGEFYPCKPDIFENLRQVVLATSRFHCRLTCLKLVYWLKRHMTHYQIFKLFLKNLKR